MSAFSAGTSEGYELTGNSPGAAPAADDATDLHAPDALDPGLTLVKL